MKKYVHIRARGPTTLSRNEGTEKHSILLQWASLRRQGKPSLFKKGFVPRFKVQATINACSPARVSFPGRNFSQQIFFQKKRKEKCNSSALILRKILENVWRDRTWWCCRCSRNASEEKKRKKHQRRRRQQQAMSFPTWESSILLSVVFFVVFLFFYFLPSSIIHAATHFIIRQCVVQQSGGKNLLPVYN